MNAALRRCVFAVMAGTVLGVPASAQPIRVLLVMPTESGVLARQVSRLNDALIRSDAHILASPSLDAADAIVRVTGYRQTTGPEGDTQNWWGVEIKLLGTARENVQPIPKRQLLVVSGTEDWETEPVLNVLSEMIARGLGRERPKAEGTAAEQGDDADEALDGTRARP